MFSKHSAFSTGAISLCLVGGLVCAGCGAGEILSPLGPGAVGDDDSSATAGNNGGNSSHDGVSGVDANGEQIVAFSCNEGAVPEATPLRRLSRIQYTNTVRDLVTWALGETRGNSIIATVGSQLSALPLDSVGKEAPFTRMDQALTQNHVDAYYNTAEGIARAITSDSGAVSQLLGDCASTTDASTANACVDDFIARFGKRALRHELTSDEIAFYRDVYDAPGKIDRDALRDTLIVMLSAPELVYMIESNDNPVEKGAQKLTAHQLAAKLSYHFLQAPPDSELVAAVEDGSLDTADGYEEQVQRLMQDPRTKATMETFVREWFGLDALRDPANLVGTPVFDAFAGTDVPSGELRDAMIEETTESLRYHAFVRQDSWQEWFTSPYSFARNKELADLYGVAPWDGTSEPPELPPERVGLLTRAALLTTGTANTRPIMKGVFTRVSLLCDAIGTPPANAANVPPELSPNLTTREVVETLTEQEGTVCSGCHLLQINGLGFPTEDFDALGRFRDQQRLFSDDGEQTGSKPVDTEAIPRVWMSDTRPVADVGELRDRMIESGKLESCFARQYVRFSFGRREVDADDGCTLQDIREALVKGRPLPEALAAIALRPEFKLHKTVNP